VLLMTTLGCGKKGPKGGTLSGKVSSNGTTVKGGQILFKPVAGGIEYPGSITAEGTYTVSGLPTGQMKVVVNTEMVRTTRYPAPKDVKVPEVAGAQEYVPVPPRYRTFATTTLTVDVTGKKQTENFDLK
jgi:hypothetical protein